MASTTTFDILAASSLSLTTDLPLTEGGTGASTAADARTNLGGVWRNQFVQIENQQVSGTAGGDATSGSWLPIIINTEVVDADGLAGAIGSNAFTLEAGTYRVKITQPFLATSISAVRFYNVTDAAVLAGPGPQAGGSSGDVFIVTCEGEFTIAAQKSVRGEYRVLVTNTVDGLGYPMSIGTEHYGQILLWRK